MTNYFQLNKLYQENKVILCIVNKVINLSLLTLIISKSVNFSEMIIFI